jgi:hypothetical protein
MSIPMAAQSADAIYKTACGPKKIEFTVELVNGQSPTAPEPGKALVYFIQKEAGMPFTTRVGLDGSWVGVIQRDSYIAVSVAPGEHHACAATRNRNDPRPELLHFTAEAGKVYYFLMRGIAGDAGYGAGYGADYTMIFGPADRDNALYLIASDPRSVATRKP